MPKKRSAPELRELSDANLASREKEIALALMRSRFELALARSSANPSGIKEMKKERARILTIQKERQLSLAGMVSRMHPQTTVPPMEGKRDAPRVRRAYQHGRAPIVSVRLLGGEYPMLVGHPYTIVLQREVQGITEIQRDLFGDQLREGDKIGKRVVSGNIDLELSFHSRTVNVDSEVLKHIMKRKTSLALQITPREPGDNRLEIFVTVHASKQLLQVLQVPLVAVEGRELVG